MPKSKAEIIDEVAMLASINKTQAKYAVKAFLDGVALELNAGGSVALTGFGSFRVQERPARTGRNPRTGDPIQIPAKKMVKFKPSKKLRESIAGE